MRIFGSERLDAVLSRLGMKEGEAIIHPWVNKSLEKAQAKVEGRNFDIRKQLLKFDDVMNDQRKVIFSQRREVMEAADLSEIVQDMRHQVIDDLVDLHIPPKSYADQWDTEGLQTAVSEKLGIEVPVVGWGVEEGVDDDEIVERLEKAADEFMAAKAVQFGSQNMRNIEKQVLLQTIDTKWREHILALEHLRSVVGFRGYAQRDPLNEYKNDSFQLFESLLNSLREDVSQQLSKIRPLSDEEQQQLMQQLAQQQEALRKQAEAPGVAAGEAVAVGSAGAAADGFVEDNPKTWETPGGTTDVPAVQARSSSTATGALSRATMPAAPTKPHSGHKGPTAWRRHSGRGSGPRSCPSCDLDSNN